MIKRMFKRVVPLLFVASLVYSRDRGGRERL